MSDKCRHLNGLFPTQLVSTVIFLRCNDCGKILKEIPQLNNIGRK